MKEELTKIIADYTILSDFLIKLADKTDRKIKVLQEQIEVRGEHIALLREKVKRLEQVTSTTYWVPEANKEYSIEEQEIDRLGSLLKRKDEYIKKLEQEVRDYAFDANNNFAICNNINAIKENERLEKLLQEKDEYIKGLHYERDKVRSIIYACTSEINENVISKLEKAYDF